MIIDYTQNKQPDFIGDIHGHFDALEMLFKKMGYKKKNGMYSHPERFPVFIGDYVDRGPKVMETLKLVRTMQENQAALALMGNHEFNFLCYHFKNINDNNEPFKKIKKENKADVDFTINALAANNETESYLKWMAALPVGVESENFRAVHAQWRNDAAAIIKTLGVKQLDQAGLTKIYSNQKLKEAYNIILKGEEVKLNFSYLDENHSRNEARVRWWKESMGNKFSDTFASIPESEIDRDISTLEFKYNNYYQLNEKPVFFGHYWLKKNEFGLTSENTCCVDFSIAKEGILGAYRFFGEQKLDTANLFRHD